MRIGIDLGTTRSAVSIVEAGSPELMVNNEGDRLTPSVVYFSEDGEEVRVGKRAKNKAKNNPDQVIRNAKREMGEDHAYPIDGVEPTPVDVSAEILKQLRSIAEDYGDGSEDITGAQITVPAYFTVDQKSDTRAAAKQAGFEAENIDLLHEPTAAAISHGFDKNQNGTVFVYDFGGGTLDISVMEIDENEYQILATAGDNHLGGQDFTQRLVDLLAEEIEDEEGVDPLQNDETRENLREVAEDAKISLSGHEQTEVNATMLGMVDAHPIGITERVIERSEFEDEVSDLLDDAMAPIDEALDKARIDTGDVDTVLLVGGSSQMPAVKERVKDRFGFEPTQMSDLDWAVAKGAAIMADQDGDVAGESFACPVSDCDETFELWGKLADHIDDHSQDGNDEQFTCPKGHCDASFDTKGERDRHIAEEHDIEGGGGGEGPIKTKGILGQSLGTDLGTDKMDILLPHNTVLPDEEGEVVDESAKYTTKEDNQTELPIKVYQGEHEEDRSKNEQLRDWKVAGIPELPARKPVVEVTFAVDKDGVLSVNAELVKPEESKLDDDELGKIHVEGGSADGRSGTSKQQAAGDDD
ncbi:Hsp70 family protein [Haloplanus rubicundus]|uniref:Hsp70 family protein n=1 Tax=Haloplanus rubicundus TaxID=1547898 RepID=A0A345E856_9EURY|nr:Hsp70 family protein [Haloplanus rubicundus]AXG08378.1 Hsp70 family protein [Haloplanus rubicundus]